MHDENWYHSITAHHRYDGSWDLVYNRLDPGTRRLVPEHLATLEPSSNAPWSPQEALLVAAMDVYSKRLQSEYGLG